MNQHIENHSFFQTQENTLTYLRYLDYFLFLKKYTFVGGKVCALYRDFKSGKLSIEYFLYI